MHTDKEDILPWVGWFLGKECLLWAICSFLATYDFKLPTNLDFPLAEHFTCLILIFLFASTFTDANFIVVSLLGYTPQVSCSVFKIYSFSLHFYILSWPAALMTSGVRDGT